ncbi:MAG: hypothetical protein U0837_00465 [Dehalococcoidia bacterium]|jgi:uncharacterized coiled-coil protein SlyX
MAFTREQVREFISALKGDAELRELARAAILSDDFAALPGLVRANTEAIAALDARIERLTERLETFIAATDLRFVRLDDRAKAVEERLAAIEQQLTSINEHLTEHDERFDRVDGHLTEHDQRFDRVDLRFDRVEQHLTEHDGRLESIDQKLGAVAKQASDTAGKLGNLEGMAFEERFIRNVASHIGPRFRRARPIDIYGDAILEEALARHPLSASELRDIATADLLVWSTDMLSGGEAALVLKVSRAVDLGDVVRADRRARLLSKLGVNAVAAVAGITASDEAIRRAKELSVVTLLQRENEPAA